MLKSFIQAIIKRWWWLMGSAIGGAQTALALIGITPYNSWVIGLIVFVVCLLIATSLAYRDLYIRLQITIEKPSSTSTNQQKRNPNNYRLVIQNLNEQMEHIHGHGDYYGIEADVRDGVLLTDILNQNCSRCHKPRNRKGGYPYGEWDM